LLGKQGSKGKDIMYSDIKMTEYLLPNNSNPTIEHRRSMPNNLSSSKETVSKCVCGQSENMEHIYKSKVWNIEHETNISKIKKVYKHFKVSFETRNKFLSENKTKEKDDKSPHGILVCDPLTSVIEYGNGNKV
jgi:hypothetical protein